ncbi:MAG: hypothetical protein H7330_05140 [Hymenobacteraceae bacterium]|nr:hypothetical protein [Hymenobacteraceae bacterium]
MTVIGTYGDTVKVAYFDGKELIIFGTASWHDEKVFTATEKSETAVNEQ